MPLHTEGSGDKHTLIRADQIVSKSLVDRCVIRLVSGGIPRSVFVVFAVGFVSLNLRTTLPFEMMSFSLWMPPQSYASSNGGALVTNTR